jgi:outer membrane protein TolC
VGDLVARLHLSAVLSASGRSAPANQQSREYRVLLYTAAHMRRFLQMCTGVFALLASAAMAAPPGDDPPQGANASGTAAGDDSTAGFQQGFLQSLGYGASEFPKVWKPYQMHPITLPVLVNSPRLHNLIQDGKLELSLSDALALTLENNLDIVVQRYVIPFAQTDILRTKSGQAARGFTGALYPSELNSGAIGAGVTSAGATGGTGNAGGITGGGGAVSIGATGAFDPSVSFSTSYDRVTSPLNSLVVSGIPTTTSSAIAYSASYAQLFTTGLSYSVSMSTLRQNTTQENVLYNPDVTSRLSIGVNQPLLAGFGRMANERFITVARNDVATADEVFKQQVITSIAQLEDAYYNLRAFQENVQVATESLTAEQKLLDDTRRQEAAGILSRLDVITAESEVSASQRDLIVAQTSLDQQEASLKQLLSKRGDPDLDAAMIVVIDPLPEPREADLPRLDQAVASALANRPELKEAANNLQNQGIAIQYAKNNMMPSLAVFGLYAASGLQGDSKTVSNGAIGALGQTFGATYPETAVGASFGASIRNRSAQADAIRSQLERNQAEISMQSTRNQIRLQVQQSRIGLIQGKAQVEAAREATRLALESRDAEQEKLREGLSVAYNVILKERDLVTAQYAEVQVEAAYANSLVGMDQATGTTLERNGIRMADAVSGIVTTQPTPPYHAPAANPTQPRGAK